MRGKSRPMFLKNSIRSRAGRSAMSNGFSEVADAANINDLADGGWQKLPVVFYSGPVLR
jgi:hypothetical protein